MIVQKGTYTTFGKRNIITLDNITLGVESLRLYIMDE